MLELQSLGSLVSTVLGLSLCSPLCLVSTGWEAKVRIFSLVQLSVCCFDKVATFKYPYMSDW